eukprot:CAMPEP_0197621744 /NCGR_PEP_ID=MMETSP1338-20131121/2226_1 /TAXON_ID=43686 ORGANISM="Pelagodinium beii, Strain RCC1491" /NCGR_SAMPLE_ID=MMETSP1338 /ASSEMBLY_ACC=CAM_ASM_000754 /LENGTH=231 /DNA_ID=CAMNT_0043191281 /DNA_START=121 /DNA_END=816 /DNA_ORIENTATION=+
MIWLIATAQLLLGENCGDECHEAYQDDDYAEESQVQLLQRSVQVLPKQTAPELTSDAIASAPQHAPGRHALNMSLDAGPSDVRTLYHMTTGAAGASILKSEFRSGHDGWCGGGIYFAVSPYDCWHKATAKSQSSDVFMIEAVVDLGKSKPMPYYCTSNPVCTMYTVAYCGIDKESRADAMQKEGYDSMTFNPGDGQEFVIFQGSRVRSMKRIPWPPPPPAYTPYYPYAYYR